MGFNHIDYPDKEKGDFTYGADSSIGKHVSVFLSVCLSVSLSLAIADFSTDIYLTNGTFKNIKYFSKKISLSFRFIICYKIIR